MRSKYTCKTQHSTSYTHTESQSMNISIVLLEELLNPRGQAYKQVIAQHNNTCNMNKVLWHELWEKELQQNLLRRRCKPQRSPKPTSREVMEGRTDPAAAAAVCGKVSIDSTTSSGRRSRDSREGCLLEGGSAFRKDARWKVEGAGIRNGGSKDSPRHEQGEPHDSSSTQHTTPTKPQRPAHTAHTALQSTQYPHTHPHPHLHPHPHTHLTHPPHLSHNTQSTKFYNTETKKHKM